MAIRAKNRAKSSTRVERKSLYPKSRERKPKVKRLQWVPTREKPIKKAPEKLPYYKDNPPKYTPASPPRQTQAQPLQTHPKAKGWSLLTTIIVIIIVIFTFTIIWIVISDDGDDGGRSCPQGERQHQCLSGRIICCPYDGYICGINDQCRPRS